MILFALTWDTMGGQMGYNSLGNILFFGVGMYACAIVQIGMFYDVAEYTAAFGAIKVDFTDQQYYVGIMLGLVAAAVVAFAIASPMVTMVIRRSRYHLAFLRSSAPFFWA